ncbi:MAG: polysaccharide deacetylase family protein, partial [Pseudomonadota bacterium]
MLILNYHRVGFPPPTARYRGMYVSPDVLSWHIKLLRWRGLEFVTVSDGIARGCPPNLAALTFDDGYLDNYETGRPVLRALGVPATVYVVTGNVGGKAVIWDESGDPQPSD